MLTEKAEFELMLFNNDSSVRIFGIINDVSHPQSDKYQDQIGLQDAYVQ